MPPPDLRFDPAHQKGDADFAAGQRRGKASTKDWHRQRADRRARLKLSFQANRRYIQSDWKSILIFYFAALCLAVIMGVMIGLYRATRVEEFLPCIGAVGSAMSLVFARFFRRGTVKYQRIQRELGIIIAPGRTWVQAGACVAGALVGLIAIVAGPRRWLYCALVLIAWLAWSAIVVKIAKSWPVQPEPSDQIEKL